MPRALTKYSLSIIDEGCIQKFANSPSLVNNINPDELISSLPTDIHLVLGFDSGKKSKTIGISFSLLVDERTPSGLFNTRSFISVLIKDMVLPPNSTISFLSTELPIFAISPLTITAFDLINASHRLLEPIPDLARNF